MPAIRGRISASEKKLGHFTDAPEVLEFVNSKQLDALAPLGTSCPDHFLRTKIRPLVLPFDPAKADVGALMAGLDQARSPATATATPPITTAASMPTRRRCATPMRSSTSSPASAC